MRNIIPYDDSNAGHRQRATDSVIPKGNLPTIIFAVKRARDIARVDSATIGWGVFTVKIDTTEVIIYNAFILIYLLFQIE